MVRSARTNSASLPEGARSRFRHDRSLEAATCSEHNPFVRRFGLWDIAKSLDAVFAMMDTDGDGVLTPEEFLDGFGTASCFHSCMWLLATGRM
jgi:hypothetical protein